MIFAALLGIAIGVAGHDWIIRAYDGDTNWARRTRAKIERLGL